MEITYTRNDRIIRRKFYQYLIPTVLMVLAMQFGSLADSIVVGQFLGGQALTASSLALPVVFLVQVPATMIGVGSSIVGANLLGKRMVDDASKVFKLSLFLAFAMSLVFVPLGIFLSEPVARLFAGNYPELVPMVSQYMMVFAVQSPIIAIGIVVAYFLPSDNSPNLGAAFFIICNVVHLAFEIMFCLILDPSVAMYGVAGSMGIGMIAGLVVLIPYARSKRRMVNFKTPLKGGFHFTKDLLRAGSTTGAQTALLALFTVVLNLAATAYLGEAELPVYAMLTNFSFVIDLFLLGVLQIMPSVISSLFGEKDYFGVKSICRRVFMLAMIVTVVLTAISMIYPQLFFYIFNVNLDGAKGGPNDPLLVIRVYCLSFLVYAVNKYFVYYYPSIMVNVPAVLSNVIRIGLAGPLLAYLLMMSFGVLGFAYSSIAMEVVALGSVFLTVLIGKKIKKLSGNGILLLPKEEKVDGYLDISIPAEKAEISKVVEELQDYAEKNSGDKKAAAMLALATEEVLDNTITYGYRHKIGARYIDINLTKKEDAMLVRIRDDGLNFDPTSFTAGDDEEMRFHGIEVVRKVASEFRYLRVLNMNNTIMEITTSKQGA